MPTPTSTPTERFATILRWLGQAVVAMGGGERLPPLLIRLIIDRIRDINQCVARLAARIGEGRHVARRCSTPRRPPVVRRPRQCSPLPRKFGWLLKLVPDAVGYRSQLEHLLRDPQMAALLAAAPASLGRPLRSLCWMLRVSPPDILAPPAKPRPPRKTPSPEAAPAPRPQPPARMLRVPRRKRWSLARICGPPFPA